MCMKITTRLKLSCKVMEIDVNGPWKSWNMHIKGPRKSWKTTFNVLYMPCNVTLILGRWRKSLAGNHSNPVQEALQISWKDTASAFPACSVKHLASPWVKPVKLTSSRQQKSHYTCMFNQYKWDLSMGLVLKLTMKQVLPGQCYSRCKVATCIINIHMISEIHC